jgi:hypothetical protein
MRFQYLTNKTQGISIVNFDRFPSLIFYLSMVTQQAITMFTVIMQPTFLDPQQITRIMTSRTAIA